MSKSTKFESFKEDLVRSNEATYGAEARTKYGNAQVDAANEKLLNATEEQFANAQDVEAQLKQEVVAALENGGAAALDDNRAAKIVSLHAAWLKFYWSEGAYSPTAHVNLTRSYLADDRFRAYYEAWAPGATECLAAAIEKALAN